MSAIAKAVHLAGGQTALAAKIGGNVKQAHVWDWLQRGQAPLEHCWAIEQAVEGKITCEELRDDVQWERDRKGRVLSYRVPVGASAKAA